MNIRGAAEGEEGARNGESRITTSVRGGGGDKNLRDDLRNERRHRRRLPPADDNRFRAGVNY